MEKAVAKFEYFCEAKAEKGEVATTESILRMQNELNAIGQDGWELVQQSAVPMGENIAIWRTWKRRIEDANQA